MFTTVYIFFSSSPTEQPNYIPMSGNTVFPTYVPSDNSNCTESGGTFNSNATQATTLSYYNRATPDIRPLPVECKLVKEEDSYMVACKDTSCKLWPSFAPPIVHSVLLAEDANHNIPQSQHLSGNMEQESMIFPELPLYVLEELPLPEPGEYFPHLGENTCLSGQSKGNMSSYSVNQASPSPVCGYTQVTCEWKNC